MPAYRRAARLNPGSADAHLGLGDALYDLARPEDAVPAYRRAARLNPGSAKAHLGLGASLYELARHEDAVPAYSQAARLNPGSADAHLGLGDACTILPGTRRPCPPTARPPASTPAAPMRT